MRKRQRRIALFFLVIMAVSMLSGCAPNPNQYKIDYNNPSLFQQILVIPMVNLLDWFKDFLGNYGWSILVLTFIIRLIIFPLNLKQQKSTRRMQEIQPEMMKIRKKYEKNPEKMQEETMKLFQKHNINPMAGCLPLLIQIPILFAFYQAIMGNEHIAQSSFLYMQLGSPDPYFILPVLAAVTTYIQLIVTGAQSNPQMKVMLWVMPAMIFFLAYQFPSALSLYWVFGNIFSIGQSFFFSRQDKNKVIEGATR
ncbi:YidC/Oxa1 family membrane protein insertase [Thermoactinomyces mirandus]|nr:YidC/Oxa1 family membrane protein insertase [Thermoactinomyces mirandus]